MCLMWWCVDHCGLGVQMLMVRAIPQLQVLTCFHGNQTTGPHLVDHALLYPYKGFFLHEQWLIAITMVTGFFCQLSH